MQLPPFATTLAANAAVDDPGQTCKKCRMRRRHDLHVATWHPLTPAIALLLLVAMAGCGTTVPATCRPGEHPVVTDTLYFGTHKPGGVVTAEEWATFVNETVTPAFPAGLTTWSASGQWRMADGTIEREPSHILQLTHDETTSDDQAIESIMRRYKTDFQQEAVLRLRARSCAAF